MAQQPRIYGEIPTVIAVAKRGVGSFDESCSRALLTGRPFVCVANVRGEFDSTVVEQAIRGQGTVYCRALKTEGTADTTRTIWQLGTNGASFTEDFVKRSIITRAVNSRRGTLFVSSPRAT